MVNFRDRQAVNRRATAVLMLLVIASLGLLCVPVAYFGDITSVWVVPCLLIFGLGPFFIYWFSDVIILRAAGGRVVTYEEAPGLIQVVDEMRIAAGMPMPRVAIVDDISPNAFATGRDPDHGLIAVTTGLLNMFSRDQTQGVIAHELSHIANRDTRVLTIGACISNTLWSTWAFLAVFLASKDEDGNVIDDGGGKAMVLMLFAPVLITYTNAGMSRRRESLADATAVQLTRNPRGLRQALEKIRDANVTDDGQMATAHMWFAARTRWRDRLLATHPPIQERIDRLRSMEPKIEKSLDA
jgi:heat shock protein HtpX